MDPTDPDLDPDPQHWCLVWVKGTFRMQKGSRVLNSDRLLFSIVENICSGPCLTDYKYSYLSKFKYIMDNFPANQQKCKVSIYKELYRISLAWGADGPMDL
jgi:hypothetical protein